MIQAKTLIAAEQLPSSVAVLYTGPPSTTTVVTHAVFTNTDSGSHTVSAYVVPSGYAADATTILLDAQAISAGATYISGELIGAVLAPGDTIQLVASAASKVAAYISGFTQT